MKAQFFIRSVKKKKKKIKTQQLNPTQWGGS